jgi:hypothetical protein
MVRKGKTQVTRPIPDWATLRPPVTEALLAGITRRIVEKFRDLSRERESSEQFA